MSTMNSLLACSSSNRLQLGQQNKQQQQRQHLKRRFAIQAIKSPKGFGTPASNPSLSKQKQQQSLKDNGEEEQDQQREADDDEVPEIVTNRMLTRMVFTVGGPLAVGVAFYGLYYYLKGVLKLDIPEWLPIFTSFITFGIAGLGISYAVISSSWDPLREGSLLGWTEAKANWPVLWESKKEQDDR